MIKSSILALVTVAAISGVAAPAFAATSLSQENTSTSAYFEENNVLARLQERGIDATSAESWGNLIRVYVKNQDGTSAQQFFTRDNLAPVAL